MREENYDAKGNFIGYGKFTPDASGNYVDDELNNKEKAAKNSYFFDAAIIPTVQYQVFGLDNVWFWDNEGQNYSYSGGASTIKIQLITSAIPTYKEVGDLTLSAASDVHEGGTEIASFPAADAAPNGAKVGDLYCTAEYKKVVEGAYVNATALDYQAATTANQVNVTTGEFPEASAGNNGKVYRLATYKVAGAKMSASTANVGGIELTEWPANNNAPEGSKKGDLFYVVAYEYSPSEATASSPYEFNKYGKESLYSEILVTLELNDDLEDKYPGAIITINGKEYDIKHTTFKLYMNQDYRISINWVWGSVVETFRIICNR